MKYRKSLFIFCLFIFLSVILIRCDDKRSGKQANIRPHGLAEELSENLKKLGSFKAEYRAVSSGNVMDITVISGQGLKYTLVKRSVPKNPDSYMVFDYSEKNSCSMLLVEQDECRRFTLNFNDIFGRLDNPVGILSFMVTQFLDRTGTGEQAEVYAVKVPALSLGLTKDRLNISMGFETSGDGLLVSWLKPDETAKAVNTVVSGEYVQYVYNDNHVITVDRKTGLLFRDSWVKDPRVKSPREIKLLDYSAVNTDIAYSSLIPGFNSIKFTDVSPDQFYREITDKFIEDTDSAFSGLDMNQFDTLIVKHSSDITAAVREAAHNMALKDNRLAPDRKKTAALKGKLLAAYRRDMEKDPSNSKNMSFNRYLDVLAADSGSGRSVLLSAETMAKISGLAEKTRYTLNRFPERSRIPMKKLYDILMPALTEGLISGVMERTAGQMKD